MSTTPPPVLDYRGPGPAEGTCPICLRSVLTRYKCKTLYGVAVCNKCRNGFANRRQAAYVVDGLVYYALVLAIAFAVDGLIAPTNDAAAVLFVQFLNWGAFPLLFTLKDGFAGRSPGKLLFRLHVVNATTRQPITLLQSFQRNLILMLPYVGVIGGAITMMKGQRWGDKWPNSMVIWNKYAFREPFAPPGRYCRGCGYDLTGNTSGRCPECGLAIADPSTPTPPPPPPPVAAVRAEG